MPDNEETFDFTPDFQKGFVVMMLFDRTFFPLIMTVEPKSFNSPILRDLATMIRGFFKEYDRAPTVMPESTEFWEVFDTFLGTKKQSNEKVNEYCTVANEIIDIGKKGEIDFKYYRDKMVDFMRYQEVMKAVEQEEIKKHMKRRDYGKILVGIQEAMTIGQNLEDLGIDVYENLEKDLEERHTTLDRSIRGIPTGISYIDYRLGGSGGDSGRGGGICPGETGIIMAFTKGGKTTISANFVREALNQGIDVNHYAFEGGKAAALELYHAMISGIDKRQLKKRRAEVQERYDVFFGREGIGRLRVVNLPVKGTVLDIENHLHQLKAQKGIDPGLLIVDYISLMRPVDRSMKYKERYDLFGQIILEIISLAQRGDYAIWALQQSTRASKGKRTIGLDDVADSMEVMRHVDLILTLNQTKEEEKKKPQVMRIHCPGGRSVESGWTAVVEYDPFTAQIWESKTEAK